MMKSLGFKNIKDKIKTVVIRLLMKSGHSLSLDGPYRNFDHALSLTSGYADDVILGKVRDAVVDVLEGRSLYERDGTTFMAFPDSYKAIQLLAKLTTSSSVVVDFGGGLGGMYVSFPNILSTVKSYHVIEQSNFVCEGIRIARQFKLPILFHEKLSSINCLIDVLLLSSVLPYIKDLETLIQEIIIKAPRYIIVDRNALALNQDQIGWWLQDEPSYYSKPVSYPLRLMTEEQLLGQFKGYRVLDSWSNEFDAESPIHRGYLLAME